MEEYAARFYYIDSTSELINNIVLIEFGGGIFLDYLYGDSSGIKGNFTLSALNQEVDFSDKCWGNFSDDSTYIQYTVSKAFYYEKDTMTYDSVVKSILLGDGIISVSILFNSSDTLSISSLAGQKF